MINNYILPKKTKWVQTQENKWKLVKNFQINSLCSIQIVYGWIEKSQNSFDIFIPDKEQEDLFEQENSIYVGNEKNLQRAMAQVILNNNPKTSLNFVKSL